MNSYAQEYERAILYLFQHSCDTKTQLYQQASDYCDRIINSENSWSIQWEVFTHSSNVHARFYALQTLESSPHYHSILYPHVFQAYMQWYTTNSATTTTMDGFLKNKLALVAVRILQHTTPDSDLIRVIQSILFSVETDVDYIFRILLAIQSEIVEDYGSTTSNYMNVKDALRTESIMPRIIQLVGSQLTSSSSALVILRDYIPWIDIQSLLLKTSNDDDTMIVQTLFQMFFSHNVLATECLMSMTMKKMPPDVKRNLIMNQLQLPNAISRIVLKPDNEADEDFAVAVGKLVNAIGNETLLGGGNDDSVILSMIWHAFSHENKYYKAQVLDIVNTLVTCKSNKRIFQSYALPICVGILSQLTSSSHDNDEEDNIVRRRTLFKIFQNVSRNTVVSNNADVVINFLASASCNNNSSSIESILSLIYYYGESVKGHDDVSTKFTEVVVKPLLISLCNTSSSNNLLSEHDVLLTLQDVIVRYGPSLSSSSSSSLYGMLWQLLLTSWGLSHPTFGNVRSRGAYNSLRFLKSTMKINATTIDPCLIDALLMQLQPYLNINDTTLISQEDQMHLFEMAGILLGSTSSTSTTAYRDALLASLEAALPSVQNKEEVLSAIGSVLKGLKNRCSILDRIVEASVKSITTCTAVRSKVIFVLHRYVAIVKTGNSSISRYVDGLLGLMLSSLVVDDLMDLVQLLNLLIIRYCSTSTDTSGFTAVLNVRFSSIVSSIVSLRPLSSTTSSSEGGMTSDDIDRVTVDKYLYSFINHVVSHAFTSVISSAENVAHFESLLSLLVQGISCTIDLSLIRTCLDTLCQVVRSTNGNGAVVSFVVSHVLPLCYNVVPKKKRFNLQDAQSGLVIREIVTLHITLIDTIGHDVFCNTILPTIVSNNSEYIGAYSAYYHKASSTKLDAASKREEEKKLKNAFKTLLSNYCF